jgi:signal transduction histidine kinase
MRRWLRHRSIATRLAVLGVALIGAIAALLLAQQRLMIARGVRAAAEARASAMARVLASGLAPALDFDDARAAEALLALAAAEPDVHALAVLRADGTVLAAWNAEALPPDAATPHTPGEYHVEAGQRLHVGMPVFTRDGASGTVVLVLSLLDVDDVARAAVRRAAVPTLAILLFVLAVAIAAGRLLARPIERVAEVATRIAAGDDDARRDLPLDRGDEVGRMAAAFDHMVGALREERELLAKQGADLADSLVELRRAQGELVQAAKMAAVGSLVAGLSHELNSPIGVILGSAQGIARRLPPDHPEREGVLAIERQAQRCRGLVRTLLDFSRKGPRARRRLEAAELARRVLELAEPHAKARGIRLEAHARDGLPVQVDVEELETALLNLVRNAVDASADGGVVEVRVREQPGVVDLEVRDSGAGIAPEVRDRIFDPFFTTKPPGEGTGLGLALAHRFVEAHGGCIDVESAPGAGTTMRVRLPLARAEAA